MDETIDVAILGATGAVGQMFVQLLEGHPLFRVTALAASERSVGKLYADAVNWKLAKAIPEYARSMPLLPCDASAVDACLIFSGLDAAVAGSIEESFAKSGRLVVSNAKNFRMHPQVPLLIPEVNADHLLSLPDQPFDGGGIITNPNCSVVGLALALKPLHEQFGIEAVHVVTHQAISGAGLAGSELNIDDNVIPYIEGEEAKIEAEPKKILGRWLAGAFVEASFAISAMCNRVPVSNGHLESVAIKLKCKATQNEVIEAWKQFNHQPSCLPSSPKSVIHYFENPAYPQPKLHRDIEKGMALSIGGLRPCPLFDYKFTLLSHNTIRGAAGGAILNAELCYTHYPDCLPKPAPLV